MDPLQEISNYHETLQKKSSGRMDLDVSSSELETQLDAAIQSLEERLRFNQQQLADVKLPPCFFWLPV